MSKLIFGVGFNSRGKHKSKVDGKITAAYESWRGMFKRCYDPKYQCKKPTYIGCTVSKQWYDFQDFADWFYSQPCSDKGYELDKDLLFLNNKIYNPDTCCFVPQELNKLLTNCNKVKGEYPQGVCFQKTRNKYLSRLRVNGKSEHLGSFDCPDEAYQVYKIAKERHVKDKALEWKNRIASEVFDALMKWELAPEPHITVEEEPTDRFAMGTPSVDHAGENKEDK